MAREIGDLSFVTDVCADGRAGRSFWDVSSTGDWTADCAHGVRLAREFLDVCGHEHTSLLGWCVRDMRGRYSGVECGFLSEIMLAAVIGHRNPSIEVVRQARADMMEQLKRSSARQPSLRRQ